MPKRKDGRYKVTIQINKNVTILWGERLKKQKINGLHFLIY